MNMNQAITRAIEHSFDMDTPQHLLPLTISHDACMLAGLESDRMGCAGWPE